MKKNLKKFSMILVSIILILLTVLLFTFRNEIKTVLSIKEIMPRNDSLGDGNTYEMNISGDYYFDEFVKQGGVKNDKDLINFVTNQITRGMLKIKLDQPKINCSSFSVTDNGGNHLFARNYDMNKTNIAIVHTNPKNGRYKSMSTVDLSYLSIDKEKPVSSLMDKIKMMAAPYATLDGINEKGVAVAVYMTYQGPGEKGISTNFDTEKPDYTTTTFLRYILDNCASVEEAIEFAKKIDMHESAGTSFQYMIADSSGNSAIINWIGEKDSTDTDGSNRKLVVTKKGDIQTLGKNKNYQVVTNFVVKPGYYEEMDKKHGLDRYNLLVNQIEKRNGSVENEEDAMKLLKSVGRRDWNNDDKNTITTHSVVYDLTNKSAYWVINEHFGEEKYIYRHRFK